MRFAFLDIVLPWVAKIFPHGWHKIILMGLYKEDISSLLTHWSYVFLALTHWFILHNQFCVADDVVWQSKKLRHQQQWYWTCSPMISSFCTNRLKVSEKSLGLCLNENELYLLRHYHLSMTTNCICWGTIIWALEWIVFVEPLSFSFMECSVIYLPQVILLIMKMEQWLYSHVIHYLL